MGELLFWLIVDGVYLCGPFVDAVIRPSVIATTTKIKFLYDICFSFFFFGSWF